MGAILIAIFLIALILGVPIAIALGVSATAYLMLFSHMSIDLIIQSLFTGCDSFPLLAIPFFVFAGDIMTAGGISKRLVNFCMSIVGKITGGLGIVTVFTSMIFASISGSGPATVAAVGGMMIPAMDEEGYDKDFACAITAAAGALGPIIPPSIAFIMYGVVAGVSISELFMAGLLPGIAMGLALMVYVYIVAKKRGYGKSLQHGNKDVIPFKKAFKEAFLSLLIPVIILGGIYGGICTPTEAAILAVDYALLLSVVIYKEVKLKELPLIIKRTLSTSGSIMILVATATAFGKVLAILEIPTTLANFMLGITDNWVIMLLIINVFLFVVGMLMETVAAVIILAPTLLAIVQPLGVTPLHFGVIMVVNLVIGMCTPPVGVNLFVAARIGQTPLEKMLKWEAKCIGVFALVLLFFTYIPSLSTFLPALLIK